MAVFYIRLIFTFISLPNIAGDIFILRIPYINFCLTVALKFWMIVQMGYEKRAFLFSIVRI